MHGESSSQIAQQLGIGMRAVELRRQSLRKLAVAVGESLGMAVAAIDFGCKGQRREDAPHE